MSSFVITNTGEIPILIAGVELAGDNTCRGCPLSDIDKIEAPEGATYRINYVEDVPPVIQPEEGA